MSGVSEQRLVLVVDDFEDNRALDVDCLQSNGYRLAEAAEPAHMKRALEARVDGFTAKPCLPADLLARVRAFTCT